MKLQLQFSTIAAAAVLSLSSAVAWAHFGIVIPEHSAVLEQKDANVHFTIAFAHPMERNGMTMAKPDAFYVVQDGRKTDLSGSLKADKLFEKASWQADYRFARPGVYQFVVEPKPYWEPAEDKFIVHYTKVIVPAYGDEDGWDKPAGVKTEIGPLTRPFANYAGNTFRGQLLVDGKPAAGADVEVEYFNRDGKYEAPNDYFVTQVVKTDAQGIFAFTAPWAGWWGFAALTDADYKLKEAGAEKDVELGAVLWTEFTAPLVK